MAFYLSNLRHLKDLQTTCNCCCKPAARLLSCHQLCKTQRRCPTATGSEGKDLLEDICENHSERHARPTTPPRRWALFLLPFLPEVFGFSYASRDASAERKWTPAPCFSRPSGTVAPPQLSPPPLPTLLFSPSETPSWRLVIKKHRGGLKKERWHCVAAWFFGGVVTWALFGIESRAIEPSGPRGTGLYRGRGLTLLLPDMCLKTLLLTTELLVFITYFKWHISALFPTWWSQNIYIFRRALVPRSCSRIDMENSPRLA